MKKFLLFTYVLLAFLIFTISYDNTSRNEYNESINLLIKATKDMKDYEIENALKTFTIKSDYKNDKSIIDEINEFAIANHLDIIYTNYMTSNSDKNIMSYYIYTSLEDRYFSLTSDDINLKNIDNGYFTNDLNDYNASGYIDMLNYKYALSEKNIIRFYPFHSLELKNKENIQIHMINNSDSDTFFSFNDVLMDSPLNHKIQIIENPHFDENPFIEKENHLVNFLIIVILLSCFLLFLNIISKSKKEICIRKLLGQTNFIIIKKIFLKFSIFSILIFIISLYCCFFLICKNIRPVTFSLCIQLLKYSFLFISMTIIINLIVFYIIYKINKLDYLKKNEVNHSILFANAISKIVILTLILQPLLYFIHDGTGIINEYRILKNNKDILSESISITGLRTEDESEFLTTEFDEKMRNLINYLNECNIIYYNLSSNDDFLSSNNQDNNEIKYSVVNKEYIKRYNIKSSNGKEINISKDHLNYLLVPEFLNIKENVVKITQNFNDDYKIIFIENDVILNTISPDAFPYSIKNSVIYVINYLDRSTQFTYPNLFIRLDKDTTYSNFISKLNELDLNDNVILTKTVNRYNQNYDYVMLRIFVFVILMFITLVVLLFYINLNISIYINEFGRILIIRYLLGETHLQRYQLIYLLSIVSYSLATIISIFIFKAIYSETIILFLILFLIDTVIQYANIKILQKRSVYKLKGNI